MHLLIHLNHRKSNNHNSNKFRYQISKIEVPKAKSHQSTTQLKDNKLLVHINIHKIQTPVIPPTSTKIPLPALLSVGPSDFLFTPQMLHSMLQSLRRGQTIIIQSLQGLGLPSIMSMDEFDAKVARPGAQPSPSGGGGAFAA